MGLNKSYITTTNYILKIVYISFTLTFIAYLIMTSVHKPIKISIDFIAVSICNIATSIIQIRMKFLSEKGVSEL